MAFRDATALAASGLGVKGSLPSTHVAAARAARAASAARGQSGSWQADYHMEEHVTGGFGTGAKPSSPSTTGMTFWLLESN